MRPLSSASDATQSSLTVQAPGADTAAAILAERFALPDSSGIQVIYAKHILLFPYAHFS